MARKYKLDKLTPANDLFNELGDIEKAEEYIAENNRDNVKEIEIEKLIDYSQHKFHIPDGEEWTSFVDSIKSVGILQPIIVRKQKQDTILYEIIAGHSRTKGAAEAGLKKVPAIVIEADDIETSILVGVTNKQRTNISDVEWGWTYRNTYELMKRPAANQYTKSAGAHDGNQQKTIDILAEKYCVSKNTIQRKIRLTYLIDEFADMYENKKLKQVVAIDISYMNEKEQRQLLALVQIEKIPLSESNMKKLKEAKEGNELTLDYMRELLAGDIPSREQRKEIQCKIPEIYLPERLKKAEKMDYVLKAVKYVWENRIDI